MKEELKVEIKRLDPGLPLPQYAYPGDAGLDLCSATDVTIKPGRRADIPTGVAVAIPEGYGGFVQPRSGLALEKGLSIVNTPGLVDSGYRGEIRVVAINLDTDDPIEIRRGDKIAQMVILQVARVALVEADELPGSPRASGGFGSTG